MMFICNGWNVDTSPSTRIATATKLGAFFLAKAEYHTETKYVSVTFKEADHPSAITRTFSMCLEGKEDYPIDNILARAEEYIETCCVNNALQVREYLRERGDRCCD